MLLAPARNLDLPLLTKRLFAEISHDDMDAEYRDFERKIGKKCEKPISLLDAVEQAPDLNSTDKSFWSGVINYYNGDPVQALECFDSVDSSDETNLAGQYYLLQSLKAVMEPAENEKAFAMKQAEATLHTSSANMSVSRIYYAGQIFYLVHELKSAACCFERNAQQHMPSLYMLHMCLSMQNSESADALFCSIIKEEQAIGGFLEMTNVPGIDPASAKWLKELELAANFGEIEQALNLVRERLEGTS